MCTSFLSELMLGQHQLGTSTIVSRGSLTNPTTDTLRAALFLTTATINAATTAYTGTVGSVAMTGEVSGNNYTAGGIVVTNANAPASSNTGAQAGTGYWTPSASLVYTNVTLNTSFDTVLFFNATQSNKAISVHTFGSQTVSSGTFTLTMPNNNTTQALLRLATVAP